MDYALPATALQGLLSGLGHPVIGIDHLFFIAGCGVLAAAAPRGLLMAFAFVAASMLAAAARAAGLAFETQESWIAFSLLALGAVMLARVRLPAAALASVFAAGGLLHGYFLAASIVGAEPTPLGAYFVGLTVVQSAIAAGAWALSAWLLRRRPQLPLERLTGALLGVVGVLLIGLA